jgi:hypothetical protein
LLAFVEQHLKLLAQHSTILMGRFFLDIQRRRGVWFIWFIQYCVL